MILFADGTAPASSLLPLLVFVAELCVVTLATMKTIFVSRGMKTLAPLLGFFEVSIWLFAIGQIMQNLTNLGCYLGFAGGFTLGNYLGVVLEKRLALGTVVVRIISNRQTGDLIERLKRAGYGVTSIDAQGAVGPVKIVFTIIKRKELANVVALIVAFDPSVFYSVDELQKAAAGIFPAGKQRAWSLVRSLRALQATVLAGVSNLAETRDEGSDIVGRRVALALDDAADIGTAPASQQQMRDR